MKMIYSSSMFDYYQKYDDLRNEFLELSNDQTPYDEDSLDKELYNYFYSQNIDEYTVAQELLYEYFDYYFSSRKILLVGVRGLDGDEIEGASVITDIGFVYGLWAKYSDSAIYQNIAKDLLFKFTDQDGEETYYKTRILTKEGEDFIVDKTKKMSSFVQSVSKEVKEYQDLINKNPPNFEDDNKLVQLETSLSEKCEKSEFFDTSSDCYYLFSGTNIMKRMIGKIRGKIFSEVYLNPKYCETFFKYCDYEDFYNKNYSTDDMDIH